MTFERTQFPEDAERLRAAVPAFAKLPAEIIEHLWGVWSGEAYCAGHMIMNDDRIRQFCDDCGLEAANR